MATDYSLNQLAESMENLNDTYDSAATAGTNDSMGDIADYSGLGAPFGNSSLSNDGDDLKLGDNFSIWATGSNFLGSRRMRDIGTGGQNYPCNQYVAVSSADYEVVALVDDVKVYKNDTLQFTLTNAGNASSVGCAPGDKIGLTRPANISNGNQYDLGAAYMGWSGFTFATARNRNAGAFLYIVALHDDTDWEVRYTTSTGNTTTTTALASGNLTNAYDVISGSLGITRYHIIYANKPVACYIKMVAGSGTNDTLPLYPMDQDDKIGAFSANGFIFMLNNASAGRAGVNVTQQIFNRSSDSTFTTEKNASSAYNNFYVDSSPGETSGTFFTGPVQRLEGGNGVLIAAESQGDGNGSEKTPFVSRKAFGKSASVTAGPTDWVTCIGESAMTITQRTSAGVFVNSQTMTGSGLYGLYFTRFTGVGDQNIFSSTSDFIMYFDSISTLDDEKVQIMGDTEFSPSSTSSNVAPDYGNSDDACASGPGDPKITVYFVPSFQAGAAAYTDAALTVELNTSYPTNTWYWYDNGSAGQSFRYPGYSSGGVQNITDCRR